MMIVADRYPLVTLLGVASLGNVLGSVVNWILGRGIEHYRDSRWFPVSPEKLDKAEGWYRRYGKWSLLASWVPVNGDPLTVVAGVLSHGLTAPFIVDAPMNSRIFEAWVETQLAPTLSPGDVVSSTMSASIKANGRRNWSRPKARGCSSCRPIHRTSIRSKWRSRNSRRCSESGPPAASTRSLKRSATIPASSQWPNAETSSRPQDMRQNKCDPL